MSPDPDDAPDCMACDLTSGALPLPGGTIHRTDRWVVEHAIGPLGVGTLIVKPTRHVVHVADLDPEESAELGELLRKAPEVEAFAARAADWFAANASMRA